MNPTDAAESINPLKFKIHNHGCGKFLHVGSAECEELDHSTK